MSSLRVRKRGLFHPALIWRALSEAGSLPAVSVRNWRSRKAAKEFIETANSLLSPVYVYLADYVAACYGLADSTGVGIDLGGGPGHLTVELSRRAPGMHWIDLDLNPHFLPYFRKLADSAGCGSKVEAVQADAVHLPFPDDYADLVVSRGSYQFWSDREAGFKEIRRVLKTGGRALIGRGFPPNLPVEVALKIHEAQIRRRPAYNQGAEKHELPEIMKRLGVEDFSVIRPRPKGSEGLSYGLWVEFSKTESLAGVISRETGLHHR